MQGKDLVDGLVELIGYKLGVLVTASELHNAITSAGLGSDWPDDMEATYRYRSEEYEELARVALAAFGDPDAAAGPRLPVVSALQGLPASEQAMALEVVDDVLKDLDGALQSTPRGGRIDPTPTLERIKQRHGHTGALIAIKLMASINASLMISPWGGIRRAEWPDLVPLRDLFEVESATSSLNTFFDQRFIDYLNANLDNVDDVHWRRFEALVGEYLHRAGLSVEMGVGRNDDGVDLRASLKGSAESSGPLVIVQCKREKRKITKTVVKALAADVRWEGAQVGLLVTTGEWSPGARATAKTRAYPLAEIDRSAVNRWIAEMRTPGAGDGLL